MTTASSTSYAPAVPEKHGMTPIAIPAQPDAIELGTGQPPDASAPEAWHSEYGSMFARNVGIATLTPFLPDPARATGAAVIVAPGGGFRILSMGNEGWEVARALNERGVAAFVLKYRLQRTVVDWAEFEKGKCEETKPECKTPPVVYCKQGLCVHRELGTPENMGAPAGEIIIK